MRLLFALSIIVVVLLAGCTQKQPTSLNGVNATGVKHEIDMTDTSFLPPGTLNIGLGDTLVFVNKGTQDHWPASDIYPTNDVYPEKGGCVGSKFDACHPVKPGESWEFTVFYKGFHCYHDNLHPLIKGCFDAQ